MSFIRCLIFARHSLNTYQIIMSNKTSNTTSKSFCDRITRHTKSTCCANSEKSIQKGVIPRKVLVSKKLPSTSSNGNKSCSTGVICNIKKPAIVKPKKSTRSESRLDNNHNGMKYLNCRKQCGDYVSDASICRVNAKHRDTQNDTKVAVLASGKTKPITKEKTLTTDKNALEFVKQYYKNENFKFTESLDEIGRHFKKISLDTINEVPEIRSASNNSIFRLYSDTDSDDNDFSYTDHDCIKKLKQFREQNYFECHSAKSRIKNRVSATNLQNHKCVYRFYLNERLFPVPLNTDYNGKIRCVECHLPMDLTVDTDSEKINATIQAKVKLGADLKDMTLLLPAKEPLIIKEKRMESKRIQEVVYFGVIKLGPNGNSVFNQTLPNNSLGLKYQKGYKEHESKNDYTYKRVDENDVILI